MKGSHCNVFRLWHVITSLFSSYALIRWMLDSSQRRRVRVAGLQRRRTQTSTTHFPRGRLRPQTRQLPATITLMRACCHPAEHNSSHFCRCPANWYSVQRCKIVMVYLMVPPYLKWLNWPIFCFLVKSQDSHPQSSDSKHYTLQCLHSIRCTYFIFPMPHVQS